MKKFVSILLSLIVVAVSLSGCAGQTALPADDEIMEAMSPYLTNAVLQDPSAYPSLNDFLTANFGLSDSDIADAVFYLGAPNQNTTFFLMADKAENADSKKIIDALNSCLQNHVKTAEMGYTAGYTEYAVIEKGDKIFAVMHEDAEKFNEITAYLSSL